MLWMVPVMFSAAQKALNCGEPGVHPDHAWSGVFWNTILTPSSVTLEVCCNSTIGRYCPLARIAADRLIDVAAGRAATARRRNIACDATWRCRYTRFRNRLARKPGAMMSLTAGDVELRRPHRTPPKWSTCECANDDADDRRRPNFSLIRAARRGRFLAVSGSKTIQPVSPIDKADVGGVEARTGRSWHDFA